MDKKQQELINKFAEEAINRPEVQENWKIHERAFGPILTPAFTDNPMARIHLAGALNDISNRNVQAGTDKLYTMAGACKTDADWAAWWFCMGLGYEMGGKRNEMIEYYSKAGEYDHHFYLPYMKVAKSAHMDAHFDQAEKNYRKAVSCLEEQDINEQTREIIASAYTNLASALTLMHRYEDAEEALEKSRQCQPVLPARLAAEAILAAASGKEEETGKLIEKMQMEQPKTAETVAKYTEQILGGRHPQFSEIEMDDEKMKSFLRWFEENEKELYQNIVNDEIVKYNKPLSAQLDKTFPFAPRKIEFETRVGKGECQLILHDYYMTGLCGGYKELLDRMPKGLEKRWKFVIAH